MLITAPMELGLPQIPCPDRNNRPPCHRPLTHFPRSTLEKTVFATRTASEHPKHNKEKEADRLKPSAKPSETWKPAETNAAQTQKKAIRC
jgi:hypothetical protein